MWRRIILAAGSALLLASLVALHAVGPPLGSGSVEVLRIASSAVPMNASDRASDRAGRLRFMGALHLESPDRRFGGISALLWHGGCNRLLAASDTGAWVVLEPDEADDRLLGIRKAWMAPILGQDGRPAASKEAADAESLARARNGDIWLFYEQQHRGMRFEGVDACHPETLAHAPVERWEPPGTAGWPPNGGIESAAIQGDILLILAEGGPGTGASGTFLAGAPDAPMRAISYAAPEHYRPTAMEPRDPGSDNGVMLVLHRRASVFRGFSAALSEVRLPDAPGDVAGTSEIARLRPPLLVDNMEALAVRAEGERRFVYLMSDDNFNPLQRIILMKFELLPANPAPERFPN